MDDVSSVDTVVVGGGIMGATTLWELARRGAPALLLEAGAFGQESTGKSAAIVRMHYSNPDTVRMALKGRRDFAAASELLECEPFYHRTGWLFLVDAADAELARANRDMQREQGSESVELSPEELAELYDLLDLAALDDTAHA
jgi:sarcosine oxidase subunit beta